MNSVMISAIVWRIAFFVIFFQLCYAHHCASLLFLLLLIHSLFFCLTRFAATVTKPTCKRYRAAFPPCHHPPSHHVIRHLLSLKHALQLPHHPPLRNAECWDGRSETAGVHASPCFITIFALWFTMVARSCTTPSRWSCKKRRKSSCWHSSPPRFPHLAIVTLSQVLHCLRS